MIFVCWIFRESAVGIKTESPDAFIAIDKNVEKTRSQKNVKMEGKKKKTIYCTKDDKTKANRLFKIKILKIIVFPANL